MNHYTYRITNIEEQKHYIGARSCECEPNEDIGFEYFSSSSDKEFMTEQFNNPQDFEYFILETSPTRELALESEIKFHELFDVGKNPNFYNKAKQTSTGFSFEGRHHTEESKKKMSRHGHLNGNYGIKMSEEQKKICFVNWFKPGHIPWNFGKTHTEETKKKIGDRPYPKGKDHQWSGGFSEDHYNNIIKSWNNDSSSDRRKKAGDVMSKSFKGKIVVKDKNGNIFQVSVNDTRYLSGELIPHCRGRTNSDETKEKMRASQKFYRKRSLTLFGMYFKNMDKACEILNISIKELRSILKEDKWLIQ